MGFIHKGTFASNAVHLIPDATIYHFGILESNVHMAWMRVVCGRLESRYRYSKDIVYNNFPWPNPTVSQKEKIEQTAQAILDARALYPDSSLADLYAPTLMPVELLKAHRNNCRKAEIKKGIASLLACYPLSLTFLPRKRKQGRKVFLLFVHSQVDSNGNSNGSTYHWVVTHAKITHHLYVSRN